MSKSRSTRLRQALLPVPFELLLVLGSMMHATPSWPGAISAIKWSARVPS